MRSKLWKITHIQVEHSCKGKVITEKKSNQHQNKSLCDLCHRLFSLHNQPECWDKDRKHLLRLQH